jgi:hypothetical protein
VQHNPPILVFRDRKRARHEAAHAKEKIAPRACRNSALTRDKARAKRQPRMKGSDGHIHPGHNRIPQKMQTE